MNAPRKKILSGKSLVLYFRIFWALKHWKSPNLRLNLSLVLGSPDPNSRDRSLILGLPDPKIRDLTLEIGTCWNPSIDNGTNETNSELDTTKIKIGFASLMADTGVRVVAYIIWRRFGFEETIVMRNVIKLASLASVAVFWIVRDDKLGAFAGIMIKKFPKSLPYQN